MKVTTVEKNSQAEWEGVLSGDEIMTVNGNPVRDDIDFLFYGDEEALHLSIQRDGRILEVILDGYEEHGMEFEPMELMSCGNHCVFCFIDQNPRGMRKTVYFKDEDFRLSFLHGAYVTLTSLGESEIQRIIEQRLSPLYVSVHATDPDVRRTILGLKRDDCLLEKMDRLLEGGVSLHTQIVVCPDINDGVVLERSIRDLAERHPGVLSVAVVPVGLTIHRTGLHSLRAVDAAHAGKTIGTVDRLRERFREEMGEGFVYCSDEWYIRAGLDIPPTEYYDDFPQIENGVGMVRDFLEGVERLETVEGPPLLTGRLVLVTGISMMRYMEVFAQRLSARMGVDVRVVAVANRFYGESVTVSGLLTGGDILRALEGTAPDETVVLPPNCLNNDGLFLDDLTPEDISRRFGVRVVLGEYAPVAAFFESGEEEY